MNFFRLLAAGGVALFLVGYGLAAAHYQFFPYPELRWVLHPIRTAVSNMLSPQAPTATSADSLVTTQVNSGLLNFDMTTVNPGAPLPGQGGRLAAYDGDIMVARDLDGRVFVYDRETDEMFESGLVLPATNWSAIPELTAGGNRINARFHRYLDVLFAEWDGERHLLVSYSYYNTELDCFTNRLSHAVLPGDWTTVRADAPLNADWQLILETAPCLPSKEDRLPYGGNQAGGRLAIAPQGGIYMTVGDYEMDGVEGDPALFPLVRDGDYGKVWHVDLPSGTKTLISSGHRNPQGLAVDDEGRIWENEHSAMGGDELNLIVPGTNYGFPYVNLGVDYVALDSDAKFWPNNPAGRHDGYPMPAHAWMPSIAPAAVRVVDGLHERWDGDLLVAGMVSQSIHRLRLDGERVVYDEAIGLGDRVRDILIDGGRLYALLDGGELAYLVPHEMSNVRDEAAANNAFAVRGCLQCHGNSTAPQLSGILGRDIASQPNIDYSPALQAVDGVWDIERLRAFLSDPEAFAPGTAMPNPGLSPEGMEAVLSQFEAEAQP